MRKHEGKSSWKKVEGGKIEGIRRIE